MNSIKDMVKDNKMVYFLCYKNNELWYKTDCGFEFPVPINDTEGAVFLHRDKAIIFMRWIRKHVSYIENAKALNGVNTYA